MREFLIADASLEDLPMLLERMRPGVEAVLVPRSEDAHARLAEILRRKPTAVHLLAHGAPGEVRLGAVPITATSLADRVWPDATGTEILVYACRAAEGEAGDRFVRTLAAATGARVAAASHNIGHAGLGGSWTLDVVAGPMAAGSPVADAGVWPHVLAVSVSEPDANGHRVFTVTPVANQYDPRNQIRDFAPGDIIRVAGASFSGQVADGPYQPVGSGQAHLVFSPNVMSNPYGGPNLYLGLDGTPGSDLEIHLPGTLHASNLILSGTDIVYAPPATRLSVANIPAQNEGDSGEVTPFTFTVRRAGDLSGSTTAAWSYTGPPQPGRYTTYATSADFVGGVEPSGTITFAPGETEKEITVQVAGNNRHQIQYGHGYRDFGIRLFDVTGAGVDGQGVATTSIIDDDDMLGVRFVEQSLTLAEGDSGTTSVAFTLERHDLEDPASLDVQWTTTPAGSNPADAGDFGGALPSGTVHFAPGQRYATFTVNVTGDRDAEADEAFSVLVARGSVARQAFVVIQNDDPAPGGDTTTPPPSSGGGGGSSSPPPPSAAQGDGVQVSATAAAETLSGLLANAGLDPAQQAAMMGPLADYLATLPPGASVTVRSLAPSGGGTIPVAGGAADALVVDARGLAPGATLELAGGYAGIAGAVQVLGSGGTDAVAGDAASQSMLLGDGNDTALGGGGNDALYGNQGIDVLYGNQGADTILGGRGDDTILGGKDADEVNGNIGNDFVSGNMGDDTVHGGQDQDTLRGGQDQDQLWGDLGDDELWGDLGHDTLVGGAGADRFCFAAGSGRDVITDFSTAEGDRIVLAGGLGYTVGQDAAGNAVIVFSDTDSITLSGIRREQVGADWFTTA